jgi:hypothetical protein
VVLSALLALGVAACAEDPTGLPEPDEDVIIAFGEDTSHYPAADWYFVAGELVGDTLEVEVEYSGGCRDHEFWLLAIDDWVPLPDAGPVPTVGVGLRLAHEDNEDRCEALLRSTLRFGLEPLRRAYRQEYAPGPARILLQIPDGRDGFAIHVFEWQLGGG